MLVAACSARAKTEEFRFDPTLVQVERVALRELAVWSHPAGHEDTQMLADDLLRMGLARLAKIKEVKPLAEAIDRTVLVVGGGLAGLEAARAAAGAGHPVVVVESTDALGGHLASLKEVAPVEPPYDRLHANHMRELIAEVKGLAGVRVVTSAHIASIAGQPGQFKVELTTPSGPDSFMAGAIVQATGARPYDAAKLPHLGYGRSPNVVTSRELDAMMGAGKLARPGDGKAPRRIVFVQCAGSRDPQHLPYCSSECCGTTLRQVAAIHRDHPEVETAVVYRDMRTPGQLERFYLAVQSQPGSMFTRGEVERVEGNGSGPLAVHLRDSLLGDAVTLEADLVVLAVGMVPNSADGELIRSLHDAQRRVEKGESESQREEARKLVEKLKDARGHRDPQPRLPPGPGPAGARLRVPRLALHLLPVRDPPHRHLRRRRGARADGRRTRPPRTGGAPRMKAVQCIVAAERGEAVHPRAGDVSYPDFFLQRCTQCKRCTEECPFGTLNEDEKGTPQFNPLRCRRCGICMGACPERIISFPEHTVDAVASMIKAMSVPEEFDEKPRILALMCENDALPALDIAASQRQQWNPWVRVIPIRCLGSMNIVWIAEALSRGIDGVMLIGCKSGDDYQCHYVRGSQLAATRLTNVQETLTRLALEPERIKVVELAHDEFHRIPAILDEFATAVVDLGANPMKGF